jgi:hypothetical protein
MVALCVGGVIVARCVDDPVLADNLRHAAHLQALQTGGWGKPPSGRCLTAEELRISTMALTAIQRRHRFEPSACHSIPRRGTNRTEALTFATVPSCSGVATFRDSR